MMSANAQALPGTRSAGLRTTQLPKASAGAIFHADGLTRDFHANARAHRWNALASQAQAFARKELENLARARHLANGFGAGLALFTRQQIAQLVLAGQNLVADLIERIVASLDA